MERSARGKSSSPATPNIMHPTPFPTTSTHSHPKRNLLTRKSTEQHDSSMPTKDEGSNKDRKGTIKRPDPPPRISSFSKRHASFNSPREVPLPPSTPGATSSSSSSNQQQGMGPVFDSSDDAEWELISPGTSKLHKDKKGSKASAPAPAPAPAVDAPSSAFSKQKPQLQDKNGVSTILPYARPYSLPGAQSFQGRSLASPSAASTYANSSKAAPPASPVDRTSSSSLPLPMQIPFSVLPKARKPNLPSPVLERSASEVQPQPHQLRPPMSPKADSSSSQMSNGGSESSGSSGSLPSAPASKSPSRSASPVPPQQQRPTTAPTPSPRPSNNALREPPPRSTSAAPMPPPELTTSHSGSVASYRPPRTTYTPVPPTPPEGGATAMLTRAVSVGSRRSLPPPEPPVILDLVGPDGSGGAPTASSNSTGSQGQQTTNSRPNSGAHLLDGRVDGVDGHAPPPSSQSSAPTSRPARNRASTGSSAQRASYEPFLSHAPPPVDSWIEVETTQGEYRLIVRLPGFKRDGITLATKKRRILHVVADSWEEGGGHFERRISFGYDADLAQVRAEFDGELLRVIIPRRIPPAMAMMGAGGAAGAGMGPMGGPMGGPLSPVGRVG